MFAFEHLWDVVVQNFQVLFCRWHVFFFGNFKHPFYFARNTESSKYGSMTINSCFAMRTNFFICSNASNI